MKYPWQFDESHPTKQYFTALCYTYKLCSWAYLSEEDINYVYTQGEWALFRAVSITYCILSALLECFEFPLQIIHFKRHLIHTTEIKNSYIPVHPYFIPHLPFQYQNVTNCVQYSTFQDESLTNYALLIRYHRKRSYPGSLYQRTSWGWVITQKYLYHSCACFQGQSFMHRHGYTYTTT